ncbi:MAG TPA: 2-hydroxychromene-2-carboxylate isomerase [Methylibium sp.]|uniref:2-hydroxychromene-2-carboxylate isomerase n=1 Tax=Methylibium sp. TaxID=2067992 RepID=UPI002DBDB946|nr:2-hydroxychromene-2-carboxylate isomerase [Methylibium sp.]HEU4460808.1 2-hydroxychromene-2-carboxylate isomerase [Methylibium sp.]
MNTKPPIEFWFDFSSPYSYIASEWIEAVAARHGRRVRWHAFLLGATMQAAELKPPIAYPLKREYSYADFARSARFEGVPYRPPSKFPLATQNAARVFWWLAAEDEARAAAWAHAGLRAMFARDIALDDTASLKALCTEAGLDAEACEAVWNEPVWKLRLKQANEAAIAAGIFGAPAFQIDGELFWGNDRKPQIERWLASGPF